VKLTVHTTTTTLGSAPNATYRPYETGYWPEPPACQPHPHCCGHCCHGCCCHPVRVTLVCTCGPFGEVTTHGCPVHHPLMPTTVIC